VTYKTILVHCDSSPWLLQRLQIAVKLALRFDAHLVGLHIQAPIDLPAFSGGVVPLDSLYVAYEASTKAEMDKATAMFADSISGTHCSREWRVVKGYHEDELVVRSRFADLLVLGQTDPSSVTATPKDLPEAVAISSGRATLVVPNSACSRPGQSVLLCWNASRESARTAAEALPFLVSADKVIVLIVEPTSRSEGDYPQPGADVAAWLARHGAKVTVQRDIAADSDVGQVILSRAADFGVDLVAMGLYGHSRLREVILGGASRTLLSRTTVPLLIAH
jgi:nucleotide-binding universal stress UspA family protein